MFVSIFKKPKAHNLLSDFSSSRYSFKNSTLSGRHFHPSKVYFEPILDGKPVGGIWTVIFQPKRTITLKKLNVFSDAFCCNQIDVPWFHVKSLRKSKCTFGSNKSLPYSTIPTSLSRNNHRHYRHNCSS